ncbi:MAG: hypothetical protein AB1716_04295 [Planctomycetota bacterium]
MWSVCLGCLLSMGCAQRRAAGEPALRPTPHDLRQRAAALWAARQAENWEAVCELLDPGVKADSTVENHRRWAEENEPFIIRDYTLGDVQTDGDAGWVEVRVQASVRSVPAAPPNTTTRWEKWHIRGGQWRPVPKGRVDEYPDAPCQRDRAQEPRLEARWAAAWAARHARDWDQMYAFLDPADRGAVDQEQFARTCALLEYLERRREWVEVVGRRGRVRATYTSRSADPSMQKLPAGTQSTVERWVLRDGEWYLDLVPGNT